MADNFKDIIIEDIKDLIEKKGCYFCLKKIEYITLGGFKVDEDNALDLQNPVCNRCWLKCDIWGTNYFCSLNCVLREAQGELTETVKIEWPEAIPVSENECVATDTPREVVMAQCDHTYKPAGDSLLVCQKCKKEVSIMGN